MLMHFFRDFQYHKGWSAVFLKVGSLEQWTRVQRHYIFQSLQCKILITPCSVSCCMQQNEFRAVVLR